MKKDYDVFLSGRNNKQNLMAEKFTGCPVLPMDVASLSSVKDAIAETRPHVIIHAAATKFVDLSEKQPMECVDVNVVGSQNVARAAIDKDVETVIGISTDKAAPPIRNIYGLSKATMEKMFCSMNGKTKTKFACVRYGNVAWSTGSVLPLWNKMFTETRKLQSTGPDMTRFFFTVEEAVKLVLTCLENVHSLQGKVLSRRMKAAKIRDILEEWVKLKGGSWEKIDGRPGDRPYECLIGELELPYTHTEHYDDILHYVITFNEKAKEPVRDVVSSDNAESLSSAEIRRIIEAAPYEPL